MRSAIVTAVCLVICLCTVSCGTIDNAVTQGTQAIDRAIADINRNSDSWQAVLQRLVNELPKEINETIRSEVQNLAARSIAVAGVEFRCDTDFLAARAVASLQRLKAWLRGGSQPPVLPPAFCQTIPNSVDLKVSPDSWSSITLTGYDLDHRDSNGAELSISLADSAGGVRPLPQDRIGRNTHYLWTLNIRGMGPELHGARIAKIRVSWGGRFDGFPEVVVLQWEPRRTTAIVAPSATQYTPPKIRGDADFDTSDENYMAIDVRGEINKTDHFIDARVYMRAAEREDDYTTVEGWSGWERIYTAPENYRIIEVRPNGNSRHVANITTHNQIDFPRPAGEVVRLFRVWGDRDEDEAGSWTRVQVDWSRLELVLEEIAPNWLR